METIRIGLAPIVEGAVITCVDQRRADLRLPFPERFAERLQGRSVYALTRRAKYLLARLDGDLVLVMHLGMTGRFAVRQARPPGLDDVAPGRFHYDTGGDPRHDHVIFVMSNGAEIRYNDARRFGFMTLVDGAAMDAHPLFRRLGVEPLGNAMNAAYLAERAAGRKQALKGFLLDQQVIAGLGNIYACEALFRARLSPLQPAGGLVSARGRPLRGAERLVAAIRDTLRDAIAAGGSSLRDYRRADGSPGYFQHDFAVYGRAGQHCHTLSCTGIVERIIQNSRSTFYCPRCQSWSGAASEQKSERRRA